MTTPQRTEPQVLRSTVQAIDIAQQSTGGAFLPSAVDVHDATVPEQGLAKDTSANIISMLIYNGFFPPYTMISRSEVNGNIQPMEGYRYDEPTAAINPVNAHWDPAYNADFVNGEGHLSFAFMPTVGDRRAYWDLDRPAETVVMGNRGPKTRIGDDGVESDTKSLTRLIWGRYDRWSGYVAFGDGHVELLKGPAIGDDHLFFDEPDRPTNAFLGIWTTAGESIDDHTFIWD